MTFTLSVILLATAPVIAPIPPEAVPYLPLLRHETAFLAWWQQSKSHTPLTGYITDHTQSMHDRQRAWQARRKIGRY